MPVQTVYRLLAVGDLVLLKRSWTLGIVYELVPFSYAKIFWINEARSETIVQILACEKDEEIDMDLIST